MRSGVGYGCVHKGDRGHKSGAGAQEALAGIPYVFTIARAAEMLGEDEDRLHDLSLGMDPEDGHLWVYDAREQQVPAFTAYGIECLQQIIADERKARRAPPARSKG